MITKEILWGEKNLTNPSKSCSNKSEFEIKDITKNTEKKFVKIECENIKHKKIWKRNCPECNRDIFHVQKWTRNRYQRDGRLCVFCRKCEDVTEKTFGYLTAIKRIFRNNPNDRTATWLFRCVCGKEVIKKINAVKQGNGDNCGCKWGEKVKKTRGIKEYEWLFSKLKWTCKKKKFLLELSLTEFLEFTKIDKCHYCNSKINWAKHSPDSGKEPENNGYHLDRKNSNLYYSKENCVVCCNRCNFGKSNLFSYDEWYGMTQFLRNRLSS